VSHKRDHIPSVKSQIETLAGLFSCSRAAKNLLKLFIDNGLSIFSPRIFGGIRVAIPPMEDTVMKVALPIWENRLSPVFDTATRLLVVQLQENEKGQEWSRTMEIPLAGLSGQGRINQILGNGIQVLLCGAISRPLYDMLQLHGIEVVAFLTGSVESVLQGYLAEQLADPRYQMPGCCHRRGRARRGRGRAEQCGRVKGKESS